MAEAWPLDEFASARVDLLRGQVAFASGLGSDAPPLLLKAARRLEPLDLDLARETYLDAWGAAHVRRACGGAAICAEVSRAARALPPATAHPRPAELLLDGLALLITDGLRRRGAGVAAGSERLRQRRTSRSSDGLRWGWLASAAASALWDDDGWRAVLARQIQLARDAGALDSCRSTWHGWARPRPGAVTSRRRPL